MDSGIAGMKEFAAVKCLHCHYAHFLARPAHGNIIGAWTHELLLQQQRDQILPSAEAAAAAAAAAARHT
jgi:hypothetical protein